MEGQRDDLAPTGGCGNCEFSLGSQPGTDGWSLLGRVRRRGSAHVSRVGRKLAGALRANGLVRATLLFSEKISEREITWLKPRLTASITYTEILPQGRLRAGVFRGFVGLPSS